MLLEPLIDALVLVRKRIKSFEREFTNNEAQTRLSLVDPVLTALEWDPRDPSAVRVEFPVRQRNRNNKADYALLDSQQKPIAFVEAKRLGTDLGLAQDQLFEYGAGESVPYAIATDGMNWAVHKRERQGANLLFKQLLAVSLADQPSTMVAVKLLSLWRGLLTSRSSIDQIAPALHSLETHWYENEATRVLNSSTTPSGNERQTKLEPNIAERQLRDQDGSDSDETFTLSNLPDVSGRKPVRLSLPGSPSKPIRNWSSLLIEVVVWLFESNRLNVAIPWKESPSSNRNVLQTTEIFNRHGMKIKQQKEVKPGLFLLLNFAAPSICNLTTKLLDDCEIDSSEINVTLAPKDR